MFRSKMKINGASNLNTMPEEFLPIEAQEQKEKRNHTRAYRQIIAHKFYLLAVFSSDTVNNPTAI